MIPENVVERIESALGRLAYWWRGAHSSGNESEAKEIEQQYVELMQWLLKWGWEGWVEPDSELPDELMPEEYLRKFK